MDSPLRLSTDRVYEGGDRRCSSEEVPGGGEVEVAVEVWVTLTPSAVLIQGYRDGGGPMGSIQCHCGATETTLDVYGLAVSRGNDMDENSNRIKRR